MVTNLIYHKEIQRIQGVLLGEEGGREHFSHLITTIEVTYVT